MQTLSLLCPLSIARSLAFSLSLSLSLYCILSLLRALSLSLSLCLSLSLYCVLSLLSALPSSLSLPLSHARARARALAFFLSCTHAPQLTGNLICPTRHYTNLHSEQQF